MKYPEIIKSVAYMRQGTEIKAVLCTRLRVYGARLKVNGRELFDSFNSAEPYDRHTSVFYIPSNELKPDTRLSYSVKLSSHGPYFTFGFLFGSPHLATEEECRSRCDSKLKILFEEKEQTAPGADYFHRVYTDSHSNYVHTFMLKINPCLVRLYTGTPFDGYENKKVRATIPETAESACKNGHKIVCGVNGDFFDILGDYHPSGLCVKNSRVIANRSSLRPFVALLSDGTHIITDLKESPQLMPQIVHAVSGLQLIVKDGKLFDTAPSEPFGETRHPRTAVGICNDGTVILCVVDGRIPAYSNGASLVDLGNLMLEEGAVRAINLDGGGSSAVYTKRGNDFVLRSRPADLFKPNAMLIRKDFNSLLAEEI